MARVSLGKKVSSRKAKAGKSPKPKRPAVRVRRPALPPGSISRPKEKRVERKRPGVIFAGHVIHANKKPPGIRSWRIADRLEAHKIATRSLSAGIERMIRAVNQRDVRRKAG